MGVSREESARCRQSVSVTWHRGSMSVYKSLKPGRHNMMFTVCDRFYTYKVSRDFT